MQNTVKINEFINQEIINTHVSDYKSIETPDVKSTFTRT